MNSHPSSRRNRRVERQRAEIMDAAARVFAEKGYAATTTRDLAEAADLGESTLYNYFASKRELFLAIARLQSERIDAVLAGIERIETRQQMAEAFVQVMDILFSQSHYSRALFNEAWVDDGLMDNILAARTGAIGRALQGYISSRITAGAFRPVDPSLAARMAISVFLGVVLPPLRGLEPIPDPAERRRLADQVINLWMDGVERHALAEGR